MSSRTGADWGSDDSVAEEGSDVRADSIGCVETSQSEPSKAADAVIKAVLKAAFHWQREDAAALSKTAKNSRFYNITILLYKTACLFVFQSFCVSWPVAVIITVTLWFASTKQKRSVLVFKTVLLNAVLILLLILLFWI